MILELILWLSVLGVLYPYIVYPLLLWVVGGLLGRKDGEAPAAELPSVSMIVPVHNEEPTIVRKIQNTASLHYPSDRLEIFFVSDGSTDRTVDVLRNAATPAMTVVELTVRGGKARALNAGLERARHDVVVFSDASIELSADALERLVERFRDPRIGCISGEDRIEGAGGEGLYGRYELLLRRLESKVGSIVGASGSFYAQRRALCQPFAEGMAPDLLSVLRTVEQGFRAVSEPTAVGVMKSVKNPRQEFQRKVRTVLRGMTTLFANVRLLNPFSFGAFSFSLLSHKLMRWLAPAFLAGALLSPLALTQSPWYVAAFVSQVGLYLIALLVLWVERRSDRSLFGNVVLYFATVNGAILVAWYQYLRGGRQEIWSPSRR